MSRLRSALYGLCVLALPIVGFDPGARALGVRRCWCPGRLDGGGRGTGLTGVDTNFVSVLGAPFGIAITPNSHDAFVASPTGSLLEYSLDASIPHLVRIDTFGTPQPHRAPTSGASPSGLALTPNGR